MIITALTYAPLQETTLQNYLRNTYKCTLKCFLNFDPDLNLLFESSTKSWFPVKCVERFAEDVLLTWRKKKLFFPSSRRKEGRQMERYLNHPQTIKFLSNCDENEEEDSRI